MATKKKVSDDTGESPEVVDETPVGEATNDGEATGVKPEVEPEESTPVEGVVDGALERAQGILGVPRTGKADHSTKMALRKYQRTNGLPQSGQFDSATR